MSAVLDLWKRTSRLPYGDRVFSLAFGWKAPYFASIRPRFTEIGQHRAALRIKDRRRVHNHLGTVHAIALCNGLEAAMGALAEATIAPHERWIPQGMEVRYTAKAAGDVTCTAETTEDDWAGEGPRAVAVRCSGALDDGTTVIEGTIRLWVTPKPSSS